MYDPLCHIDIIFSHPESDHQVNHMPAWVIPKEGYISYLVLLYLILPYCLWLTATINEPVHEISNNVVCAYAQSDQSLC